MNTSDLSVHQGFSTFCAVFAIPLSFFGILANSISVFVFLQPHFRQLSINLLLAALSVVDFCLLLVLTPVSISIPIKNHGNDFGVILYEVAVDYLRPMALTLHCASVWLLVLVSCERWVAVCKPFLLGVYCTRTRALQGIALVTIFSLIYTVFELSFSSDSHFSTLPHLHQHYPQWQLTLTALVLSYTLPLFTILCFNALIVKQIIRSKVVRRKLSRNVRCDMRTSRMMLVIALIFAGCYLPSLIFGVIELISPEWMDDNWRLSLAQLCNLLAILQSSCTFCLYFNFSSRYRQTLLFYAYHYFCPRLTPPQMNRLPYSLSQISRCSSIHISPTGDRPLARLRRRASSVGAADAKDLSNMQHFRDSKLSLPTLSRHSSLLRVSSSFGSSSDATVLDLMRPGKKSSTDFSVRRMFRKSTPEDTTLPAIRVRLATLGQGMDAEYEEIRF